MLRIIVAFRKRPQTRNLGPMMTLLPPLCRLILSRRRAMIHGRPCSIQRPLQRAGTSSKTVTLVFLRNLLSGIQANLSHFPESIPPYLPIFSQIQGTGALGANHFSAFVPITVNLLAVSLKSEKACLIFLLTFQDLSSKFCAQCGLERQHLCDNNVS